MERKIGELFYVQGVGAIKCIKSKTCTGCVFNMGKCLKPAFYLQLGCCHACFRSDKKSIKFIKYNDEE